jgi:hypothetical protein
LKIVLSRKGFDTKFGGGASPIMDGRPVSLPIPASNGETTTYEDRGLAQAVVRASRGRIAGDSACHDDPMFADGHCWLGQVGAAQGHLRNQGVGPGDVFLFFGLFADPATGERHHRLFGYMRVLSTGAPEQIRREACWREPPRPHPHLSGQWHRNNALWFGEGKLASSACDALRLTTPKERRWARWSVPGWMMDSPPTYLRGDWRRINANTLDTRGIWQEGVCDIGDAEEPMCWLESVIAEIGREA